MPPVIGLVSQLDTSYARLPMFTSSSVCLPLLFAPPTSVHLAPPTSVHLVPSTSVHLVLSTSVHLAPSTSVFLPVFSFQCSPPSLYLPCSLFLLPFYLFIVLFHDIIVASFTRTIFVIAMAIAAIIIVKGIIEQFIP